MKRHYHYITRIIHWSVVLFFLSNQFVFSDNHPLHQFFGMSLLVIVVFRLLWGVTTAPPSNHLSNYKFNIRKTFIETKEILLLKKKQHKQIHASNAFGAYTLWLFLLLSGISGYISDTEWGLANEFGEIHSGIVTLNLWIFYFHLLCICLTCISTKSFIIKNMIFGK